MESGIVRKVFAVLLWIALLAPTEVQFANGQSQRTTVNANEYIDKFLDAFRLVLNQSGYDPLKLEPYDATFEYHLGLIIFVGQLRLDNSTMNNLSSVHRKGDSLVTYENKTIEMVADFQFSELVMNSTYTVKVINIGKIGEMIATINNLTLHLDLLFEFNNFTAQLKDFEITNPGWIKIDLNGNIIDELSTILVETITNLFKYKILKNLEENAREKIEEILSKIHF